MRRGALDDLTAPVFGVLVTCAAGFGVALLTQSVYGFIPPYAIGFGGLTYWVARMRGGWTRVLVLCAGLSWLAAFAALVSYGSKFYGFVAFLVCALSVIAAGAALGRIRLALCAIPPALYFGFFIGSQVAHQVVFELAHKGHVTQLYDSCAAAFIPWIVPFSLIYLIVSGCIVSAGVGLVARLPQPLKQLVITALILAFGALCAQVWQQGWHGWIDAERNQPCL